ncbi:MAG: cell division protein ZapA [Aliidongia sp.]
MTDRSGQVEILVNGRSYRVACDDGQEAHAARLGRYVDQKVQELVQSVGQIGDARLLLMASLLVADELVDTDHALNAARNELATARVGSSDAGVPSVDETVLACALDSLAQRIEAIAAELERD